MNPGLHQLWIAGHDGLEGGPALCLRQGQDPGVVPPAMQRTTDKEQEPGTVQAIHLSPFGCAKSRSHLSSDGLADKQLGLLLAVLRGGSLELRQLPVKRRVAVIAQANQLIQVLKLLSFVGVGLVVGLKVIRTET